MKPRILVMICILCCLLNGCESLKKEKLPDFNGMIYNLDNEPVSGVKISVEHRTLKGTEDTTENQLLLSSPYEYVYMYDVQSDIYGHFTLGEMLKDETYRISFSKKNYENKSIEITYSNSTQVLYVQLCSGDQFINLAEEQLKINNYTGAIVYLDRASAVESNQVLISYLRAIIEYQQKHYIQATDILNKLIDDGIQEAYIYLFLADIYQYDLHDTEKAEHNLYLYLERTYDPDTEKRLGEL
jgi:hypothetical protein